MYCIFYIRERFLYSRDVSVLERDFYIRERFCIRERCLMSVLEMFVLEKGVCIGGFHPILLHRRMLGG